jgi:molybdenum cofactor synthesis domain-containing protein
MSRGDGSYACYVNKKAQSVKKEMKVKILTVSDGVAHGVRENKSSKALLECVSNKGWIVEDTVVSPDGDDEVAKTLLSLADNFHGLIITTGGTGFGPRDQTPEGTLKVIDREAPGLAEAMRLVNPLGRLSRGVAGTIGTSLVVNTPGSEKGCIECLEAIIDVIPHAVGLLSDNTDPHPV